MGVCVGRPAKLLAKAVIDDQPLEHLTISINGIFNQHADITGEFGNRLSNAPVYYHRQPREQRLDHRL